MCSSCLAVQPDSARARLLRGLVHEKANNLLLAQKDLQAALALAPSDPEVGGKEGEKIKRKKEK
jgi:hypothetical protein